MKNATDILRKKLRTYDSFGTHQATKEEVGQNIMTVIDLIKRVKIDMESRVDTRWSELTGSLDNLLNQISKVSNLLDESDTDWKVLYDTLALDLEALKEQAPLSYDLEIESLTQAIEEIRSEKIAGISLASIDTPEKFIDALEEERISDAIINRAIGIVDQRTNYLLAALNTLSSQISSLGSRQLSEQTQITALQVQAETTATVTTTDATITTLATFPIPVSTTYSIEAIVTARRTGGSSGTTEDGARYKMSAVYKNVSGSATLIGVIDNSEDEDQASWDATFAISGSSVLCKVTGAANNTINWKLTARTYQIS